MYGKHQKKDAEGNPKKFGNGDVTVFFASNLYNEFEKLPPNILQLFTNVKVLELEAIGLKELDENTFKNGRTVEKIIFGKDHIETISANVFLSCTSLKEIQFNGNTFDTFDNDAFAGLKDLNELTFTGNGFTTLRKALFEPLTGLTKLSITNNQLKKIDPDFFFSKKNLQVIDLSDNELTHFPSQWLTQKNQLTLINLNNNKIATIDSNILKIWPNNAALNLIENECISKSYDHLGTNEWPMSEAAKDMKSCFEDDSSDEEDDEAIKVIELENKVDNITEKDKTSSESSIDSSESPESVEDEAKSSTNEPSVVNLFSHDGKDHDRDSDAIEDDIAQDYTTTPENVSDIEEDEVENYDKVGIEKVDQPIEKAIDEPKVILPVPDDNEDSNQKESEVKVNAADKKKEEDEKPIKVDEANVGEAKPDSDDSESPKTEPTQSDNVESTYLHPYEKANSRFYVSARNQYTCVIENAKRTLKHIVIEHKPNYTDEDVVVVFIRNSSLINIPAVILDSFPNLKSLSVENSGLKTMDDEMFANCGQLEHLDLSNNRIERVKGDSLKSCTKLKTVDLSNNPIDIIDSTFFVNSPGVSFTLGSLNIIAPKASDF